MSQVLPQRLLPRFFKKKKANYLDWGFFKNYLKFSQKVMDLIK